MTPNQEKQKERARMEAEHHSKYSNVTETNTQRAMDPSVSEAYLNDSDLKYRRDNMHDYIDKRYDYEHEDNDNE